MGEKIRRGGFDSERGEKKRRVRIGQKIPYSPTPTAGVRGTKAKVQTEHKITFSRTMNPGCELCGGKCIKKTKLGNSSKGERKGDRGRIIIQSSGGGVVMRPFAEDRGRGELFWGKAQTYSVITIV